ncbi:Uncharacterized protein SCF082_LOCUS15723 [Durusdinium trenchii]|uniref:Uncharacterized protein n=1 Tax=Durusdinium trenchii TaxID=1381693 RepID=A0ABP0K697_9DINO
MECKVIGVAGRGFPGAAPPGVCVSVVSVRDGRVTSRKRVNDDDEEEAAHEQGRTREDFETLDGTKETVGDIFWKLREPFLWEEKARCAAGERRELRIRVANVASVRLMMHGDNTEDAQLWRDLGDPDVGYQVKLVLRLVPSKHSEQERSKRLLRIQQRQIELEMMQRIPADKLLEWETSRKHRSASAIQRTWKSKRQTGKRTSVEARRRNRAARGEELHLDGDDESDRYLDLTPPGSPRGSDEEAKGGDLMDDTGADETEDDDLKQMQVLFDQISREAFDRKQETVRFSTHEQYQHLIEQSRQVERAWPAFEYEQRRREGQARQRRKVLRKVDRLCNKLDAACVGPLDKKNENEEEDAKASVKREWPLSKARSVVEQARTRHVAALQNVHLGKDWWRVRLGNEERDVRKLKPSKPPWSGTQDSGVRGELASAENELSRWWIAFASGNPSSVDAILDSRYQDESLYDVFDDAVRRETERLIREAEQKLKARESPLLATALSCPPHRLGRLRDFIKAQYRQQRDNGVEPERRPLERRPAPMSPNRVDPDDRQISPRKPDPRSPVATRSRESGAPQALGQRKHRALLPLRRPG